MRKKKVVSLLAFVAGSFVLCQQPSQSEVIVTPVGATGSVQYSGVAGEATAGFAVKYGTAGYAFHNVQLQGSKGGTLNSSGSSSFSGNEGTLNSSGNAVTAKGQSYAWTVTATGTKGEGGTATVTTNNGGTTISGSQATGFTVVKF